MAQDPSITLSVEDRGERGRIARIVVDYQARLNILNSKLIAQLTSAVESLRQDERLRVLIPVSYTHLTLPTIYSV